MIPYGPSPSNKCITQYFRHTFTIPTGEKDLYSSLVVRLLRDDGAAVYLNGIQIISSNLPNAVGPTTPASSETDSEDRFFQYSGIKNYLNDGANILAVEVHQRAGRLDAQGLEHLVGHVGAGRRSHGVAEHVAAP